MKIKWLVLVLPILIASCSAKKTVEEDTGSETLDTYVLVVSFDGYRWDYSDLYETPNFDQLEESGVKAEHLISSFPTKTFPNHYMININTSFT